MSRKRMKLKSKKKRFKKIKLLIYIFIIYFSFALSFYYISKERETVSNEEFINLLISTGNANILNEYRTPSIINKTIEFLFDIDLKKPVTVLNNSILKYGNLETVGSEIQIEYNDDYSNLEELKNISDYIEDPNPKEVGEPLVYIYNSHQLENYSNKELDIYGITPNVLMASYLLREKLSEKGISSIVEDANMSDILSQNNWNYAYSYQASRMMMEQKIGLYPSLSYFIDIHRDSITKEYSTVNLGDKSYAKMMLVVGKDHSSWQENYNTAVNLNNIILSRYPGLSRGVLEKSGVNVNGVYNQDVSGNCILIELGGVDNTIEEVNNTLDVIAEVLKIYIKGE